MDEYKAPEQNCVFIGLGVGVSPEIPELSEDLFIEAVMQHSKRDVIIEIMERVYKKLIIMQRLKHPFEDQANR